MSGAVGAQDVPSTDEATTAIEEIIVTAGRREQSLQDVPASVVAISPDAFINKGMKQVKDILNYIPGIQFTDRGNPGTGNISARGVPQSSSTPVFGIYLDDTPLTSNTNFSVGSVVFFDGLLMDIERVEVIKGPQGTLYGSTSVGGMLRYISREPALQEIRVTAGVDVSKVKGGEVGATYNGRVSVPIIRDKIGITVAGYYQDVPGYVDYVDASGGGNDEADADRGTVKGYLADLLFTPSENMKIRLKYIKQESDSNLPSYVNLLPLSDQTESGDYLTDSEPGSDTIDFKVMSGTFEYDFGGMLLTSTTSKTEYNVGKVQDITNLLAGYTDYLSGAPAGTTTSVNFVASAGAKKIVQEVRLTSAESDTLEWIAGVYYTNEDTYNIQDVQAIPVFDLGYANFPSEYTEYAAFGDVTYYFNDKFDITGGVRVSKNEIALDFTAHGALLGETNIVGEVIKDTVKTFLLAGRYRVDENLSVYTRIASGFRPAQPNLPAINPSTGVNVAPYIVTADKAWSYEIGVKGSSDDKMVSYEVALWKIDWANFQSEVTYTGVSTGGNAADGLSAYGFEGSVTAHPVEAFSVTANLGYTKSTLNSDEPTLGGVGGENYPGLPNWKGSLQWNYAFEFISDWNGNFGGGVRHIGSSQSVFSAALTQASVKLESRTLADLNLGFSNGKVAVGLYATNLFNNKDIVNRDDDIIGPEMYLSSGVFERPRTIGANLRLDF